MKQVFYFSEQQAEFRRQQGMPGPHLIDCKPFSEQRSFLDAEPIEPQKIHRLAKSWMLKNNLPLDVRY